MSRSSKDYFIRFKWIASTKPEIFPGKWKSGRLLPPCPVDTIPAMADLEVSSLISVAEAARIVDGVEVHPNIEAVSTEKALGRVLASAILADRDYPPFDRALMDGFALRAADAPEVGATLRVIGEVAAGHRPTLSVGPGEAAAIMTGAPMPDSADAVVPVERTDLLDGRVRLHDPVKAGQSVTRRGTEARCGAILLEPGTRLGPAQLAVAATVGTELIDCFARPRCAILATGDELAGAGDSLQPWQIRNSNTPMLAALIERVGGDVLMRDIAADDLARTCQAIEHAAERADVVLISGGMSMGRYDFVPQALGDLGFEALVTKVRIRPGKPFVFAIRHRDEKFVFGLPGNPVSAFVCTVRLAARLIRRLSGLDPEPRWIEATLTAALPANGPRELYQPVEWDGASVGPLAWKGSGDQFTLARANALLVRPEHDPPRSAGQTVRLLEIPSC